ncbi:MAG: hypothetical protein V1839_00600 [archaeon]
MKAEYTLNNTMSYSIEIRIPRKGAHKIPSKEWVKLSDEAALLPQKYKARVKTYDKKDSHIIEIIARYTEKERLYNTLRDLYTIFDKYKINREGINNTARLFSKLKLKPHDLEDLIKEIKEPAAPMCVAPASKDRISEEE